MIQQSPTQQKSPIAKIRKQQTADLGRARRAKKSIHLSKGTSVYTVHGARKNKLRPAAAGFVPETRNCERKKAIC